MKKVLGTIVLSVATLGATTSIANAACGIECWLSNTFSTNDGVGDWLRDTFGPVHQGSNDNDNKEVVALYKSANKIALEWKPSKELAKKRSANYKPVCSLEKLLIVVNKEKNPDVLLKTCFQITAVEKEAKASIKFKM